MKTSSKLKTYFNQLSLSNALRLALFNLFRKLLNPFVQNVYSESGEEIWIEKIIGKKNGFYLEVGSNHPIYLSNTYRLYCNGWKGICIDGNSALINLHKKVRPKDIALNCIVSDEEKDFNFHKFKFNPVSTISESNLDEWKKNFGDIESSEVFTAKRLDTILNDLTSSGKFTQQIDVLSIDVEGHDFQVLRSIDLDHYKPRLILIEMHGFKLFEDNNNEVFNYLQNKKYDLIAFIGYNGLFKNKSH